MGNAMVRHPGEGEKYRALGDLVTVLASGLDTDGAYEVFVVEGQGEPRAALRHAHPWSEAIWVLRGQVELFLQGQHLLLEAGAFAHCPCHQMHSIRLLTPETQLLVVSSQSQHSRYVRRLDREAPFGSSSERAVEIARQFEVEVDP